MFTNFRHNLLVMIIKFSAVLEISKLFSLFRHALSHYRVRLQTGRPGLNSRQRQITFPLASLFRPALGPTQPSIQWVPGGPFPGGKAWPGCDATNPHLVPRSRMSGSYFSSPPYCLHGVQRDTFTILYFTLFYYHT
jgi:hypothetical protein